MLHFKYLRTYLYIILSDSWLKTFASFDKNILILCSLSEFYSSEKSVKFCPNRSVFLFFRVHRLRLWSGWWWWLLNPEWLWEHQWRGHTNAYPALILTPKHTCNLHLITSIVCAYVCKMRKKLTLHTTEDGKLQLNKNKDPTFLLFHRCVFWAHMHQVT